MTTTYTRENPFLARISDRFILNKPGSTKKTYHITLDISDSGIEYQPGDTLAILPSNHPDEIAEILNHIHHDQKESLKPWLTNNVNLSRVSKSLREFLQIENKHPDLLTCLSDIGGYKGPLEPFLKNLSPLMPRFYSIASSMQCSPTSIDLLIATFTHSVGNKQKPGVGSDFLCHQASETTPIPLYLQPTKHFTLPEDKTTPIIMIGPGTGVAPFRAFLQERQNNDSKNWLIFGERQKDYDFYYEDFFQSYEGSLLVDTAFSRDQTRKIYVQDRLLEKKEQVWQWLNDGAIIYICGDAKRMAKDVQQTLANIIAEKTTDPASYIKMLRKEKRLRLDVY